MKTKIEKPVLANLDLPESERGYFCDARPEVVEPMKGIWENFLNWARANSLWILGFGTGCGAIELRPLMTARYDMYRYGVQPETDTQAVRSFRHRRICFGENHEKDSPKL